MSGKKIFFYILSAYIAGTLLLVFIQYNSAKNINKLIQGNQSLLKEIRYNAKLRELEKHVLAVEDKIRGRITTGQLSMLNGLERNFITN